MANPSPSNSSRRSAPHPSRSGGGVSRPLYAIDFTAVACGKRIANTKRRVRWRFGFANPDALAAGETGTACRGEEHDVTMVWSVTSGKRLILADGQEVHYSNSRSAVIDFSWTMRGNHVLKVIAHATAPMSADPGFRQYDFFVDGRSFFTFPKVYRLGLSGSRTVSPRAEGQRAITTAGGGKMAESSGRRKASSIAAVETPHNRDEEDAYLAEAIKASLEEQSAPAAAKSPEKPKVSSEAADLLIDFMDDWNATGNTLPPAPAPAAPAGGSDQWALAPAPVQNNQWAVAAAPAAPAADAWAQPAAPAFAAPPATPAYSAAPSNPFSPPPAQQQQQQSNFGMQNDPFSGGQQQPPAFASPQPSVGMTASAPGPFAAPSNVFSPAPPAPAAAAPVSQPPITSNGSMGNQQPPAPANVPLTMGNLSSDGLLGNGVAATDGSMADKALQNLMGSIDSFGITGSAAKPSNPFDTNNITNNQTLGEIKSSSPKKPVMNAAPPRAMVMSNNQSGNWGMGIQQQQQPQYGGGMGMGMQQQPYGGYPQQQSYNMGMQGGMQQQPMQGGMQQPPPMQGGMPPQYGQQQPPQWGAQGPTY
mmetsp:Transcript_6675/g.9837  ORF Transcript_6675/g.9837 Transcript_6675/m.9837 type:complete len:589 (-) Transcript_6675:483-2249(-)